MDVLPSGEAAQVGSWSFVIAAVETTLPRSAPKSVLPSLIRVGRVGFLRVGPEDRACAGAGPAGERLRRGEKGSPPGTSIRAAASVLPPDLIRIRRGNPDSRTLP